MNSHDSHNFPEHVLAIPKILAFDKIGSSENTHKIGKLLKNNNLTEFVDFLIEVRMYIFMLLHSLSLMKTHITQWTSKTCCLFIVNS